MAQLGLGTDASPAQANTVLDRVRDLFDKLDKADSHRRRIEGIDSDSRRFSEDVAALADRLAPDLVQCPAHQAAVEKIAALSRAVSGDANRFLAFAERGHPAMMILSRQQAMAADLVVIRKRARSLAEAVLLGSVTRHVLSDVASDVLLLAEPKR